MSQVARVLRVSGLVVIPLTVTLTMTLAACSGGDGSSGPSPTGPVTPTPTPDRSPTASPSTAMTAEPGAAVATGLRVVPGCEGAGPNNYVADFSWRPADPAGDGQRLVLSYVPGGLDTDAFLMTAVLPADQTSYHWIQMNPGTGPRTWRVLTLRGDAWVPSETATFHGVDCPDA